MKKYLKNFGNIYAERRDVTIVGKPPSGMHPSEYRFLLQEESYKGVPYKNKYLYSFEYWLMVSFMFSPFWLGYLLRDHIYPILIGSFKILLTVLLWIYRL